MKNSSTSMIFGSLSAVPETYARIRGSARYPGINGEIFFFAANGGTVVLAEVQGLPVGSDLCEAPVFGFHIHAGSSCTGTEQDPFRDADGHYNPRSCEHPHHSGDLPPLFGNAGYAWQMFYTDRFQAREVAGKTVIIHRNPDDFVTQPSGNAGEMIACGVIQ